VVSKIVWEIPEPVGLSADPWGAESRASTIHRISIALAFGSRSVLSRSLLDPGVNWNHDGVVDGVFEKRS